MNALVTGFEAWGGKMNPSGVIARDLDGTEAGDLSVVGVVLPEDFYRLPKILNELVAKHKPRVFIGVGWDYISRIKVEKIALNVRNSLFGDKTVPDNYGHAPEGEKIIARAPTALSGTLPAEAIVDRLNTSGTPAFVSYHAGTHCCNTVMFSSLYSLKSRSARSLVGFIHIPPVEEMGLDDVSQQFSTLPISKEREAIETALRTCSGVLSGKSAARRRPQRG